MSRSSCTCFVLLLFTFSLRFGPDDFEICLLWCRHNYHFFVDVVHFVSLLLLLMLLFFYCCCCWCRFSCPLLSCLRCCWYRGYPSWFFWISSWGSWRSTWCCWCFGFCFCCSFWCFGTLLDVAGLLVVGDGVSANVAGIPACFKVPH